MIFNTMPWFQVFLENDVLSKVITSFTAPKYYVLLRFNNTEIQEKFLRQTSSKHLM